MARATLLRALPLDRKFFARGSPLRIETIRAVVAARPKLLDQVREAIRTRHYSYRTEEAYVGWVKRFIPFHGKRHPAEMGAAEVSAFLLIVSHPRARERLHPEPSVKWAALSLS